MKLVSSSPVLLLLIFALVFLPSSSASSHQQKQQQEQEEPLPCILQHGCVCDHNKPHQNPKDLQWYGTCINCTNQMYTGWDCASLRTTCVNNGKQPNPQSVCDCPDGYSGSFCQNLECINSKTGTGPHSVSPASPYTNNCLGMCKEGWGGFGCELCETDAACAKSGSGKNSVCYKKLATVGTKLNWECNLTGILEYYMTQNNFSFAPGSIQCENPTGWGPNADPKQGNCAVTVYRSDKSKHLPPDTTQPPSDTPPDSDEWVRWQDQFMFCTLQQCTQQAKGIVTPPVYGSVSEWSETLRRALVYTTFGFCGLLAVVVAFAPTTVTARVGPWIVLLIGASIIASITVAVSASLDARPLLKPGNETLSGVVLECKETKCVCAEAASLYGESCKGNAVEGLLKQLTGETKLECNTETQKCSILQSSVSYLSIDLKDCVAAACVSPSDLPKTEEEEKEETEDDSSSSSSLSLSSSSSSGSQNNELFGAAGETNKLIIFWVSTGVVELLLLLCICHAVRYFYWVAPEMKMEWHKLVSSSSSSSPSQSPSPSSLPSSPNNETTSLLTQHGSWEETTSNNSNNNNNNNNKFERKVQVVQEEKETILRLRNGTFDVPEAGTFSKQTSTILPSSNEGEEEYKKNNDDKKTRKTQRRRILHDVEIEVRSGRSLALLGGSGSGKTTTLNLLAASKVDGIVGGELSINDFVLDLSSQLNSTDNNNNDKNSTSCCSSSFCSFSTSPSPISTYRSMIGFVHQDDRLIEYLTVRQCIFHAARMRLPLPLTDEQITELVDEVIDELGLSQCKNTQVGGGTHIRGVSGGERRRVSIACELVGYPHILLLDEPTSGLDALSARKVMQLVLRLPHRPLRTLQKYGGNYFNFKPIVIFSIHQPSADIYQMFDQVMVLVSGRKVVFDSAQFALDESLQKCGMTMDDLIDSMQLSTTLGQQQQQQQDALLGLLDEIKNANKNEEQNNNNTVNPVVTPIANSYHHKRNQSTASTNTFSVTNTNNRRGPTTTTAGINNARSSPRERLQKLLIRRHSRYMSSGGGSVGSIDDAPSASSPSSPLPSNVSCAASAGNTTAAVHQNNNNHKVASPLSPRTPHSALHERSGSIEFLRNVLQQKKKNNKTKNKNNNDDANDNDEAEDDDDDDDDDDDEASLIYFQLQQLNEQLNVNPAELLLQVALKLYDIMMKDKKENGELTESDDDDEDEDNNNNKSSHHRHATRAVTTTTRASAVTTRIDEVAPTTSNQLLAFHRFQPGFWHQLLFLFRRSRDSFTGMFQLTAVHLFAAMGLSLIFSFLYEGEKLDLDGTENKAGMITFLLLIVAFSSMSCLELLVSESRVFASDYDRGLYGVSPYFLVKVLFDIIPHRILPTAILAMSTYFPMGLRTDSGIHYLMFITILLIFSVWNVALCICIGLLAGEFGTGALACALVILWNTAFGGLMIQPASVPYYFRPFKYLSPQFFAYEAVMVNELIGQMCLFNPETSNNNNNGDGVTEKNTRVMLQDELSSSSSSLSSSGPKVTVSCTEFILNLGLDPEAFLRDLISLIGGSIGWIVLAIVVMNLVAMLRKSN